MLSRYSQMGGYWYQISTIFCKLFLGLNLPRDPFFILPSIPPPDCMLEPTDLCKTLHALSITKYSVSEWTSYKKGHKAIKAYLVLLFEKYIPRKLNITNVFAINHFLTLCDIKLLYMRQHFSQRPDHICLEKRKETFKHHLPIIQHEKYGYTFRSTQKGPSAPMLFHPTSHTLRQLLGYALIVPCSWPSWAFDQSFSLPQMSTLSSPLCCLMP